MQGKCYPAMKLSPYEFIAEGSFSDYLGDRVIHSNGREYWQIFEKGLSKCNLKIGINM